MDSSSDNRGEGELELRQLHTDSTGEQKLVAHTRPQLRDGSGSEAWMVCGDMADPDGMCAVLWSVV